MKMKLENKIKSTLIEGRHEMIKLDNGKIECSVQEPSNYMTEYNPSQRTKGRD